MTPHTEAIVDGEIVLLAGFPERTLARIEKALSFGNPKYFLAIAADRRTEGIPETIEAARGLWGGEGTAFPRGAAKIIKKVALDDGIRLKFKDRRSDGVRIDAGAARYKPRYYQLRAAKAILRATQGLVIIPCGGGKTTVGVDVIRAVERSAVVLVHTGDLHDQWLDVLHEKLRIDGGSIIGSKWKPREDGVTVASVPKLVRMLTSRDEAKIMRARDFLAGPGVCILDEAHHAPANTFQIVLRNCPARVRLGLTATPNRDDGMTRLVDWSFGKRVFEISVDELVDKGFLIRPTLEIYETEFRVDLKGGTEERKKALEIALMNDQGRINEIAKLAARQNWRGKVTLILSNRREYSLKLSRAIWKQGVEASVITSDSLKSVRKAVMKKFRAGEVGCLIATSLADEGLDCPSLSRIILAWPEAPRSRTIQRIGRLMRPYKVKPVFVDVVDVHVKELRNSHEQRQIIYRKLKMIPPKKRGSKRGNDETQMRLDR